MSLFNDVFPIKEAWVLFSGRADLPWLKILKPGFRHCAVIVHDGRHWISIDPLSHCLDVHVYPVPADFDLPGWLRGRGQQAVRAPLSRIKKQAPWMPFTCVEAVKRVLGVHNPFIVTPWQLYRHLRKNSNPITTI